MLEEFKYILKRNGSTKDEFLKYMKSHESELITYEKMLEISNEFVGIKVDNEKW